MENNELLKRIEELENSLSELTGNYYSNNFKAHQDFNKACFFNTKLKVPTYTSNPSTCEVGEVVCVNGTLKVCSATNTWTTVGTQT